MIAGSLTDQERQRVERIDELTILGAPGVDEIITSLDDRSWTVRRAAVAALVSLGDEAAAVLVSRLASHRTSEREIAATVDALSDLTGTSATREVTALVGSTENPAVLADVAAILGRRRAREAIPVLARLLSHADDNVAVAAIDALGKVDDRAAPAQIVDPLLEVVASRHFFRTFAAIQVLARSADPRAVEPLAALVADDIFGPDAIAALGRTGSPRAVAPLAAAITTGSRPAAVALAELLARADWSGAGPHVIDLVRASLHDAGPALIGALAEASGAERAALVKLLPHSGDATVLSVLAIADAPVRAELLAAVGARTSAPTVRALLDDDDAEVRTKACDALARIGDTDAVPALFERLADSNLRVAHAAAAAIHSLHAPATTGLALHALATGAPALRKHALRILAYLGPTGAFDAVRAVTSDPDPRIAELAVAALGSLEDSRTEAALAQLAASPSGAVRASVMRAAGQRGGLRSLLERGLTDDDAWVRYYACQALGRSGDASITQKLVERLSDATPHVRIAAIEALARTSSPAAWQALASTARSHDPDERRAALVGMHGPAALVPLLDAAADPDLATQLLALDGLARQPDSRALAALVAATRTPELTEAAVALLATRSEPAAVTALLELAVGVPPEHPAHAALTRAIAATPERLATRLEAADEPTAATIVAALARTGTPAATTSLLTAVRTANAVGRRAAAIALAGLGTDRARAAVAQAATTDPDPDVRRSAAAAIAR